MDRRTIIKGMAIIAAGIAMPTRQLIAAASVAPTLRHPFHRFALGELELTVLTDGHIPLSPVQANFPNGSEEAEKELLKQHFRSTEVVDLGMNILVIKSPQETILLDTGTGGNFGPDSGWLLSSMKDAGISRQNITQVVISHAHPDHIGGLLTKEGKPTFLHAQVHLSKAEHAFWTAAEQDFSKSKFQDKKLMAHFVKQTQATILALQEQIHLFEDKAVLFDCLRMELAPGHTPGHTLTHIFSGKEKLVHLADLIHSDVLSFPHPEWGFNGDTDIDLATATRKRILANFSQAETKVFGYHLPWPGIGHIRTQTQGYEWIPETYSYPS